MTTSGAGTAGTDLLSTRVKLEGVGNYVTQGRGAPSWKAKLGVGRLGLALDVLEELRNRRDSGFEDADKGNISTTKAI